MYAPYYCVNSILSIQKKMLQDGDGGEEKCRERNKKKIPRRTQCRRKYNPLTMIWEETKKALTAGNDCDDDAMSTRIDFYVCIKKHKHF